MSNSKYNYQLHIKIYSDTKFFGRGVAQLLLLIERYGSLQKASTEMGLAYSKAWSIIKKAESELNFKLTERTIGGIGGGGSSLTKEGKEFLNNFLAFEKEVCEHADLLFTKHFGSYL